MSLKCSLHPSSNMTLGFQMKQLFGNNSVVVSGSASLPIVSAGSLATMMQVSPAQEKLLYY